MPLDVKTAKRVRIILLTIAVVALALSLILFFQVGPKTVQEVSGSYSLNASMLLEDRLSNNSLYGNNTSLLNPSIIYKSITQSLSMNIQIDYSNSNLTRSTIFYSYNVYVISTNPSWQTEMYHVHGFKNVSGKASFNMDFGLNVSANQTKGEAINSQLNFPTTTGYSLEITMLATSTVGTSNSNLSMSIGNAAYTVTGPKDKSATGTYSTPVSVPGQHIINLPKYFFIFFAAGAISMFVAAFIVMPPRKPSPVEKFKRSNAENLIEISRGPPKNAVKVNSTEDIFKIGAFVERPVFLFKNRIYIRLDSVTYYAEIAE